MQISKSTWKGAKESNLYKYMITIDNCDHVDTGTYTCKVGDYETKGGFTVTESKLVILALLYLSDTLSYLLKLATFTSLL